MRDRPWIVVPCYNEAERLDADAFTTQLKRPDGPRFVFVDDGSTDATLAVLRALESGADDRCEVLALGENRGKAEAVRAGLGRALEAGALRVGYWDADLATPLDAIADFEAELDRSPATEVVLGSRVRMLGRHIERSRARHLMGRVFATLASLALRLPVYDTQCGAKLFRRSDALVRAVERPFGSRWAFDVELLQRLQREWGDTGIDRIIEVPLRVWRDVGESKVSLLGGARAYLHVAGLLVRSIRSEDAPVAAEAGPGRSFSGSGP